VNDQRPESVGDDAADDTALWLRRAADAAAALRGLRQRLLALHAELAAVRAELGTESLVTSVEVPGGDASFVWPSGRTPN
jgi:hypothetical protein